MPPEAAAKNSDTILKTAMWNVEETARRLNLNADLTRRIVEPKEQIRTAIHPQVSNGAMLHASVFLAPRRAAFA
jgi:hypothetical protein